MTYERLIVERRGSVGWLINNRPDRLNAYDVVMRDEFRKAWAELDADPDVRVIVHTGNGRAFQVGADVGWNLGDPVVGRYRLGLCRLGNVRRGGGRFPVPDGGFVDRDNALPRGGLGGRGRVQSGEGSCD